MTQSGEVKLNGEAAIDMARLHDKLYLLSKSIFIRRLEYPFTSVGEIGTPDIKSPHTIVSCSKTSCLYIYDKGADCIWKVSIPDHRLSMWLDKVQEPGALSVTSNAELLMLKNSKPICLEVYNEHAILVRRLKLHASIHSVSSIYETPSGKYFLLGKQGVLALKGNGTFISQFGSSKYKECWGNPRCFDMSPYHIFLHWFPNSSGRMISSSDACSSTSNCGPISSLTFDLASHQSLKTETAGLMAPINSCYLEKSKQLLVLEGANTWSRTLRIYDVFPA